MKTLVSTVLIAVLIVACSTGASSSPSIAAPSASPPPATPSAERPSDAPVATPSADPTPDPSSPALPVGEIECDSGTGGNFDYVTNDVDGGLADVVVATRAVPGVLLSDEIASDGNRTSAYRDGHIVFSASWMETTAGLWVLSSFSACPGFRPTPPFGLARDSIVAVVVDGLRVRGLPSTSDDSVKFERLLMRGDLLLIVDGPVEADGYEWYLVQSLQGGQESSGPFGWVAAASRGGETWIDDVDETVCPRLPDEANQLGTTPPEILVHCYGSSEIEFELDANVGCLAQDVRSGFEPSWFGQGCFSLSGDACGSCGLDLASDPASGVAMPDLESARWRFKGHFDDPAAAGCRATVPPAGDTVLPEEVLIHFCRTRFAVTELTRLGDPEE